MDIAVDSSGFGLKTSSKWFDIRIKRKSEKKAGKEHSRNPQLAYMLFNRK